MKSKLVLAFLMVSALGMSADNKPAGGKYGSCQRKFDSCMDLVVGKPGSQSYNVGHARCYAAWKDCVKPTTKVE